MTYVIDEGAHLAHYGILRKSGRYPWGSGSTQNVRNKAFLDYVADMRDKGLSEVEICKGLSTPEHPFTTSQLRAAKTIARNQQKQAQIAQAVRLKEKQYSNVAIGKKMDIPESTVRLLLKEHTQEKANILNTTAAMLREQVAEKKFIDVGTGVELHLDMTRSKLNSAIAILKEEGYQEHKVQVDQLGTSNKTTIKVLCPPGTTYRDVASNKGDIQQIRTYSNDGGRSFFKIQPPMSVDSSRIGIRYAEDGGTDADGVIYVRPGVADITLGGARYAQVRVAVDGTHYLKGMAMYKDDLPAGQDLVFNTNKPRGGNKLDAMKEMKRTKDGKIDPDNPFGAVISQLPKLDEHGNEIKNTVRSAMNIVNTEGDWEKWSRSLSSQMLSKQSPVLAKSQLEMVQERRKNELDSIMSLTNPSVRRKLLEDYADGVDAAAVHLKAAALPNVGTHVILPMNSMKETEIYAPNYTNGERVALIRYPHGGRFEIPELTVNNRHPKAKKLLGNARDAVGINAKVAERLSGADFDGDTVLVIPNNSGRISSKPALEGLKNFDPRTQYKAYEGMPKMSPKTKQVEMGKVSNLITDMTIKGANDHELAQAVRHSMVVIDAEKHHLDYKQSALDNNIASLKKKYQTTEGSKGTGASTLISRATSEERIRARKPRSASKGGPVDPETGRKMWEPKGDSWVDAKGKVHFPTQKSTKLAEAEDANTLSSGTRMEELYANHSNYLKGLANQARKEAIHTKVVERSPSAARAYAPQVKSLNAKLNLALRNRPLERQAQVIANTFVEAKLKDNPGMEREEIKRLKFQALEGARIRMNAKKHDVVIEPEEWAAIQAGAIAPSRLKSILDNSDLDVVKKHATPRANLVMTSAKQRRAQAMLKAGFTQAEVAAQLGVALSTLKSNIYGGE